MIETQSRSCEGWFPKRCSHKWFLWNHPSRDPLRDPAALLRKTAQTIENTRSIFEEICAVFLVCLHLPGKRRLLTQEQPIAKRLQT